MKFFIYENGKKVATVNTSKQWKKVVTGLNSSMDIVDAPYQKITVKQDGKTIYKQ